MKNLQRKKTFKGRVSSVINVNQTLWKGVYGVIAKESARITEGQIKAVEFALKRVIRKNGTFWTRLSPTIAVTKKPAEVRMGKGKGNIKHFIARVKAGTILFELHTPNEILARQAFKVASSKLPLQTTFVAALV